MAGRPLKFSTPEILQELVDNYFSYCDENDKPYTVSGLAVFIDTSRETLMDYEDEIKKLSCEPETRKRFADVIKKAKAKVEASYEERLFKGTPVGAIFALKNMKTGWADERSLNQTIKQDIIDEGQAEALLGRRKIPLSEVTPDVAE